MVASGVIGSTVFRYGGASISTTARRFLAADEEEGE